MNREFPTKTQAARQLPDGSRVIVKTLNTLERREALDAADVFATKALRPFRKGGELHDDIAGEFADLSVGEQVAFIVGQLLLSSDIAREAASKHPIPEMPERAEGQDEDSYGAIHDSWEDACEAAKTARDAFIEQRHSEEQKRVESLAEAERIARCLALFRQRRKNVLLNERFNVETLLRAVRVEDKPQTRYFASTEQIAELDEAVLSDLLNAYFGEADTVSTEDIPTLPAA